MEKKKFEDWLVIDGVLDFSLPVSAFYAKMIPLKMPEIEIDENDKVVISYYLRGKRPFLLYRIFMDLKIAFELKFLLDADLKKPPKRTRTLFFKDVAITQLIDTPPLIHTPYGTFSFLNKKTYLEFANKLDVLLSNKRFEAFLKKYSKEFEKELQELQKAVGK